MYYIGFDIGGTKCAVSLGKAENGINILKREEVPTDFDPKTTLEKLALYVEEYKRDYEILGAGISCGGPLDTQNGCILNPPNLKGWTNFPIVSYIKERFSLEARLQNDANACAIAEWKFGAGQGKQNIVFLTFGTGLGAGLILNGKLYEGANGNAGEVGHIRLAKTGPYAYGKYGSFESFCSGSGIARLAKIGTKNKKYAGAAKEFYKCVGGKEKTTTKELAKYAREGNTFCKAVFRKSSQSLGKALSMLVDTLNPECIILGGVFMRCMDLLLPECKKVMAKECLPYSYELLSILPAGLGEQVGDYAAIAVAMGDY